MLSSSLRAAGLLLAFASVARAADEPAFPTYAAVGAAVQARFTGGKDDFDNRLLTRADVEPVFADLEKLGWTVNDSRGIAERFLPSSDPLVKELRRPESREFSKRIAGYPCVYDRLDRLRGMPYGLRRIREFATTKDGHQMLRYMTDTKGGAAMQKQIARGQGGRDFAEPTGRMYTLADLLAVIRTEYDAEAARREKAAPKKTAAAPDRFTDTRSLFGTPRR